MLAKKKEQPSHYDVILLLRDRDGAAGDKRKKKGPFSIAIEPQRQEYMALFLFTKRRHTKETMGSI